MNKFKVQLHKGSYNGSFNIYQARNGKIYILMGNSFTALTLKQINDLNIPCYDLIEFNIDIFNKAYDLN